MLCIMILSVLLYSYTPLDFKRFLKISYDETDVIICLSASMDDQGNVGESGKQRVVEALEVLKRKRTKNILFSGGYMRPEQSVSLAQGLLNYAKTLAPELDEQTVILEEQSRDTIGNAVFSRKLLKDTAYKRITLVTSDYHMKRSLWIFKFVFGGEYHVEAIVAESDDVTRAQHKSIEESHLAETILMFEGIKKGNMKAIEKRANLIDPKFQIDNP